MHDDALADLVVEIIATAGPLTIEGLVERVGDRASREQVDYVLYGYEVGAWHINEWLATGLQLAEGRYATHRLSAEEAREERLDAVPDLELIGLALDGIDSLALETGGGMQQDFGPADADDLFCVAPSGWLKGARAGDVVALSVRDGVVSVQVNPTIGDEGEGDLPNLLREAFERTQNEEATSDFPYVVGLVCIDHPEAFAVPRRPLGELLAAAGLSVHGDEVADADVDWDAFLAARKASGAAMRAEERAEEVAAGRTGRLLLADLMEGRLFASIGALEGDAADNARAAFSSPEATGAFLSPRDGSTGLTIGFDVSIESLRQFANAVIALDSAAPPAGAYLALSICAEFDGDVNAQERAVVRALEVDPTFEPALADLAMLAAERGQARRALGLYAGTDAVTGYERMLERFTGPGRFQAGRNDRCPCGSGQKHKLCCAPAEGHPLADRAQWLYHKVVERADRSPARRARMPLAERAADTYDAVDVDLGFDIDLDSLDEHAMVLDALEDDVLVGLHLFEGGYLAELAKAMAPNLPADERALLAAWMGTRHRLWRIVARPNEGGAWTVEDAVSHETVRVRRMQFAPPHWVEGTVLFGTVAPIDLRGESGFVGPTVEATDHDVKEVLALFERPEDVEDWAAVYADIFVRPLVLAEGAATAVEHDDEYEYESAFGADDPVEWISPGGEVAAESSE